MSWGVALRNAVGLGLGGIPSLLNAAPYPLVNFNFLSGHLDPRITFSRTSNATLIGSDGTLQYAPHNLLTYSEQFDDAAWTKAQSTITSNSVVAPDGTATADKLVEDATNSQHVLFRSTSIVANTPYAVSGYFKAGERTRINFRLLNGTFNSGANVTFDLSAGTTPFSSLVGTATNLLFSITPVGNGWYRCAVSCVVDTTSTTGVWAAYLVNTGNNDTYLGDGTSGIYTWGAQLNVGALQPYYQTVASAYYGPRFDYDPVTLAAKGLLIEEQRTNLCLYSNDLNQATWGKGSTVSLTYDTATAPDGTTTADTITVVSGADTGVYQNITCASSTTYTWSLYVKLGTMAASDYKIAIYDNTNAAFIAVDIVPTQTPSSAAWTRITYTFTTPATCVSVRPYCFRNGSSAATSVNVWGMQLEQGAFATSYIPTVAASLTRAADVASVTGANFSSWYNSVEGTLVTTTLAINQTFPPNRYVSTMDDGTTNNIIGAYIATDLNASSFVVNGGVAVYQEIITTVSNTSPNSIAVTYKANDFMSAARGVLGIPDTSGNVPVVNKITFGNRSDGARPLNGHIRSFKYYPTRLRDSALQLLTR